MNILFPLCLFGRHKPRRNHVRQAHGELVGHCKRCGMAIQRRGNNDWVRDTHPSANVRLKRQHW